MHESFVDILCCPLTRLPLKPVITEYSDFGEVWSGSLISADNSISYPVVNGIPRFVTKSAYCKSFDYEWSNWSKVQFESENKGKPMEGFTPRFFNRTTCFTEKDLSGKMIVEFGCGGGRYLDVVLSKGAIAVGIDISNSVESAYKNLSHYKNVLIVQGDILSPPFKDNVFDSGFSIGVFHHTPNPENCVKELIRTIKPGSMASVLVYAKDSWYDSKVIKHYRKIFNFISPFLGDYPAIAYSHISARLFYHIMPIIEKIPFAGSRLRQIIERNILVVNELPDLKWRILDTFDAVTPKYASTHTPEEVRSWFEKAACVNIENTDWNKCGWRGQKPIVKQEFYNGYPE